jgi:hypothetical protein
MGKQSEEWVLNWLIEHDEPQSVRQVTDGADGMYSYGYVSQTLNSLHDAGMIQKEGTERYVTWRPTWPSDEPGGLPEDDPQAITFTRIHPDLRPELQLVYHPNGAWYTGVVLHDGTVIGFDFKVKFMYHEDGTLEVQHGKS